MKRVPNVSPIERMLIGQQWRRVTIEAEIHALMGEDSAKLVNAAGRVFFVCLGACIAEDVPLEMQEVADMMDGVEAVHDQTGEDEITPDRRARIVRGLGSAMALIEALPHAALVQSAVMLAIKMRRQDILLSDFHALRALG